MNYCDKEKENNSKEVNEYINNKKIKWIDIVVKIFLIITLVCVSLLCFFILFYDYLLTIIPNSYFSMFGVEIDNITFKLITFLSVLPLAWVIPMSIIILKKMKNKETIGVGLKICTLIFVNTIAGILLLCKNED